MLLERIVSLVNLVPRSVRHIAQYALFGSALLSCGDPRPLDQPEETVPGVQDALPDQQPETPPRIAYVVSDGTSDEMVIADETGTELQRFIFPWEVHKYSAPCWTTDRRRIVVFPAAWTDEGLFTLDVATGSLDVLVQSAGMSYGYPNGSANGDMAVLVQDIQGEEPEPAEVVILRGTDQERVTHNLVHDYSPVWAPDGRLLYVSSTGTIFQHQSSVYVYDGEHHTELPTGVAYVNKMVWAPDSNSLMFFGGAFGETNLHSVSATGGSAELLATISGRVIQWAPHGRYLMMDDGAMSISHALYRWDVAERQLVQLTGSGNSSPAISPDSEYVLFRSNRNGGSNLFKMRWDGTEVQQLTFLEDPVRAYAAEWQGYCR